MISVQRPTHRQPRLRSASHNISMGHFATSCLFSVLMETQALLFCFLLGLSLYLGLSSVTVPQTESPISHQTSVMALTTVTPPLTGLLAPCNPPYQTPSKTCHCWHLPQYHGFPFQRPFQSGISLPLCLYFHPLQWWTSPIPAQTWHSWVKGLQGTVYPSRHHVQEKHQNGFKHPSRWGHCLSPSL